MMIDGLDDNHHLLLCDVEQMQIKYTQSCLLTRHVSFVLHEHMSNEDTYPWWRLFATVKQHPYNASREDCIMPLAA